MFTQFHTKSWPRNREMQKTTTYTPWNSEIDVLKEKSPFPSQRPKTRQKMLPVITSPKSSNTHYHEEMPFAKRMSSEHVSFSFRNSGRTILSSTFLGLYPPTSLPMNQPQHPTKGTSSSYASYRHLSPELLVGRTRYNHHPGSRKNGAALLSNMSNRCLKRSDYYSS